MISAKRVAEIAAIPDEAIDTTDIPEAGEQWFQKAAARKYRLTVETPEERATLRRRLC